MGGRCGCSLWLEVVVIVVSMDDIYGCGVGRDVAVIAVASAMW